MLKISDDAAAVLRHVSEHPRTSDTSGIRLARGDAAPGTPVLVAIADAPRSNDTVVDQQGARLFLDPSAKDHLDEGELDAVTGPTGRVKLVWRAAS